MRTQTLVACLLTVLSAAPGAGAANLAVVDTSFGWNPLTQTITQTGSTPLSLYPAVALNQIIEIEFNSAVSKSSVDFGSVRVVTLSASQLPSSLVSTLPGGQVVPVELKVKGNRLTIRPDVLPTPVSLGFGYVPGAFYRIELLKGGDGLKSTGGETLKKPVIIDFRAIDEIVESSPGAPKVTVSVVDTKKGNKKLSKTQISNAQPSFVNATPTPPPQLRFAFSELVIPTSVVNPATFVSPTIRVELDGDGEGATSGDRSTVPGSFTIEHTVKKSTVFWTASLNSIPGEALYIITIQPLIQDLSGNSVFSETGDIGAIQVFAFRTKLGEIVPLPPIHESFDNQLQRDVAATSADWGVATQGLLKPGFAGGSAADGPFPPASVLADLADPNVPKPLIYDLPTEQVDPGSSAIIPRPYNFGTFEIPAGLIVRAAGRFGLDIHCSGTVTVSGVLDVSGAGGEVFDDNAVTPGFGGDAALGAAAGGTGGSVTTGPPTFTPTIVGSGFQAAGYQDAVEDNQGLTGISSAISDFSLTRSASFGVAPSAAWDGLWLQPNVGTGVDTAAFPNASPGDKIDHNHPAFRIDAIAGNTLDVIDDPLDADFYGSMLQPSLDVYTLPPPPIANPGDPFVVGDLDGHPGTDVGFAGTGGLGGQGLSVAQSVITQVRSGGGGGGGGRGAGEAGEDSPSSGVSTGTPGAAGGDGYLSATVASASGTTLVASGTPFAGLTLGPGVDPDTQPAYIVFPDVTKSIYFEIASNTDSQIVITPVTLLSTTSADLDANKILNLADVTGLGAGATLRVEPSFRIGGAGGGGSGVHLGNTPKFPPPPNLTLPTWTAGAGGGAGGGALVIDAVGKIAVTLDGQILARGGDGGTTDGNLSETASGGGGGGGGSIVLRSADSGTFAVDIAGLVDARGGSGGAGLVEGGPGGDGRVRVEGRGVLNPAFYVAPQVNPPVSATDVGVYLPQAAESAATSLFYNTGALAVTYTGFEVVYNATVNGVPMTGLTHNLADLIAGEQAPFQITFDDAAVGSNGMIDPSSIDGDYVEDPRSLTGALIRFRIVLTNGSTVIGANTFTAVQVGSVTIDVAG